MEEPRWQDGGASVAGWVAAWWCLEDRWVAGWWLIIDVLVAGWQLIVDVLVVGRVDSAQNK